MKKVHAHSWGSILALLLLLGLVSGCGGQKDNQRMKYNFNPEWKLLYGDPQGAEQPGFDDASWKQVTLPHAFNEDDAFRVSISRITMGIVWYRKHFVMPKEDQGKKVFIEFEGIHQGGVIYLNGDTLGLHENGVMAFGFDITDKVKFGEENVFALRIDNTFRYREQATDTNFQWNDRNFNVSYGGITKNVFIHVTDRLYQTLPLYTFLGTTGVYIYPQDIDVAGRTATITTESEVKNEYPVAKTFDFEVRIYDMKNRLVKTIKGPSTTLQSGETGAVKASDRVSGLNFWSWGYGYLYNVVTSLSVDGKAMDEVTTRTGFRKTAFNDGRFTLNDRVLQLKGYGQRTTNEWPAVGLSVPPWISDFSNGLIVEGNGNLIRWMHITPWKQDVESCDRVGLMQAMPAGDAESDARGRQWEQRKELMRDAMIYNRNNPSIIFYECGNKEISEEHMQEMKDIRNLYDPNGGRAIGAREMLGSEVAEYGGEMMSVNKSAHIPFWATEYARDEGLRKYWDELSPPYHKDGEGPPYNNSSASSYNRNQDSYAIENVNRWYDYWRERPGTGNRVNAGGVNIIFSDSNTHYRGAESYRRSGEVDAMRLPKDGFWAHQVMWDGWVDLEQFRTHIIGHWNYAEGTVKDINVVSGGEKVELFINGVSKGFGEQSARFLFTFKDIAWEPGEIKAVSYDAQGVKLSEASHVTAGEPAKVKLTLHTSPQGFYADGADFILVDVEVVDAKGIRCPTSNAMINFTLDGPAEWRGGLAQGDIPDVGYLQQRDGTQGFRDSIVGPNNYILAKDLPVECGVNRVIIRSSTKAGKVKVTASSEGLRSSSVSVTSKSVKVVGGLSEFIPGAGLPSNLGRGPTPSTPSFKITRIPVGIKSATAGINEENVQASYDDNERTDWGNDGALSTAWITYQLDREATVSEVTMKLSGSRSRQYLVQILVGDSVLFEGTPPRSMGYTTIKVTPTKGSSLTVKLIGSTLAEDAISSIVELGAESQARNAAARGAGAQGAGQRAAGAQGAQGAGQRAGRPQGAGAQGAGQRAGRPQGAAGAQGAGQRAGRPQGAGAQAAGARGARPQDAGARGAGPQGAGVSRGDSQLNITEIEIYEPVGQ